MPSVQLVTVRSNHDFRLVRHGTYPPHRGALCRVCGSAFLYTVGYQPQHLTYPGPHVPVPLEIITDVPDVEPIATDLLCLTRMNWNNAFYIHNCSLRELLTARAIRPIRTRPYTPRTNGKVERYQQTLQREWAYAPVGPHSHTGCATTTSGAPTAH